VLLNVEASVWDSPNSAGVVIDAVRMIKLALDRGVSGTLEGPSAYLMKSPPVQYPDDIAHEMTEAYIRGDSAISSTEEEMVHHLDGHKQGTMAEKDQQLTDLGLNHMQNSLALPLNDVLISPANTKLQTKKTGR
jgi:hypothetical protein